VKTFYTERDIEDLHANGVTKIEVDDEVVLTDLAREKAERLGIQLKSVDQRQDQIVRRMFKALGSNLPASAPKAAPSTSPTSSTVIAPKTASPSAGRDLVQHIKARVIARLGTTEYNNVLDQVIPQVLARLTTSSTGTAKKEPTAKNGSNY
jgi:hypothetical protein